MTNKRRLFLKKYGMHPLSQTTQFEPFSYFDHPKGYIAYQSLSIPLLKKPIIAVVGDPVCAPSHISLILKDFIQAMPQACFYHSHPYAASHLQTLGYKINQMGTEQCIHLPSFTPGSTFRRKINRFNEQEVTIRESSPYAHSEAIIDLHQAWIKTRVRQKENTLFMTKPHHLHYASRTFLAWKNNKLIGLRRFDPLYHDGSIKGYYADLSYTHPSSPAGLCFNLLHYALNTFKNEGHSLVSLGLSPFTTHNGLGTHDNKLVHTLFNFSYNHLNKLYAFKGLTQSKRTISDTGFPVYFAAPHPFPFLNLLRTCINMVNV